MNLGDAIKHSNSWHWLLATVAVSAATSVFVPQYGWRDALSYRERTLSAWEKDALDKLQEAKALCAVDMAAVEAQTRADRAAAEKVRTDLVKYGIEELPVGDKAVFLAQSRVGEALNKRKLRVVSTEARVAEKKVAAASNVQKKAGPRPRPAALVQKGEKSAAAKLPFKTETLDYRVAGDFRDMFMFFVGETHQRPYYAFGDIAVECGENGMDLSFQLRVHHK